MKSQDDPESNVGNSWLDNWGSDPTSKALELAFFRSAAIWALSLGFTLNAIRRGWFTGSQVWLFPTVTVCLSLVMAYRYYIFLKNADELARKIQLEAIAFAFGVTTIIVMSLETFEPLGVMQMQDNYVVAMMGLLWSGAQVWWRWHYR